MSAAQMRQEPSHAVKTKWCNCPKSSLTSFSVKLKTQTAYNGTLLPPDPEETPARARGLTDVGAALSVGTSVSTSVSRLTTPTGDL